ncbi:hypothetical protein ACUNWD_10020 [Sunxiuqinia sp. A32]|uniref:hypothetical protein n=1 Tax=Sunxiuqinia sp. A32 TaxID=3461496 RepID=UPI004045EEEF
MEATKKETINELIAGIWEQSKHAHEQAQKRLDAAIRMSEQIDRWERTNNQSAMVVKNHRLKVIHKERNMILPKGLTPQSTHLRIVR